MKQDAYSPKLWDQRAEAWEKVRLDEKTRKNDERIHDAVDFLRRKGLLRPEYTVADIGCGPGRFAVAFAKHCHHVVGFDVSEKMIAFGREHAARHGQENVRLLCRDFREIDVEKEGYSQAFDLVFSSLTPAIHNLDSLKKSMTLCRGYCCNITHVSGSSQLEQQIAKELFGREPLPRWDGRWFRYLSEQLRLLGYEPECSYFDRHQEQQIRPDEAYVELLTERLLPPEERSESNRQQIRDWILSHVDEDGLIWESSDARYGRTLWSVGK